VREKQWRGVVDGENPCVDQGIKDGNDAAGMAAGDRHFLCGGDGFLPGLGKFRKSVNPVVGGAVGGGGIENPDVRILHGLHDFFGRRIGKAEEHEIRLFCKCFDGGDIFSLLFGKGKEFYIFAGGKTVMETKAGGTGFTNNENFRQCCRHMRSLLPFSI
jgi:hypothetical protein